MPQGIKFAFDVEPREAVAFLRQKKLFVGKIKQKALHQSALARATTISRMSSLEMTRDIYQSLETAVKEGKSFAKWKKEMVAEFERKGWVVGQDKNISRGIDGKLLADPKTGEYFGTPRRLNTIFRVNTQAAYSAGRYQRMMDNIDNRPYWQYSAVGDQRTRPAHLSLNGRIYRYDDPFWTTFYPPNGFNCRCTVIPLSQGDLTRKGIKEVPRSEHLLTPVQRPLDKKGNTETTTGIKLPDGRILATDKGFDYNVGRLSYKPNLDLYPEKLAHQFAKAEMAGAEFKLSYQRLENAFLAEKEKLGIKGKISAEQMLSVRDNLNMNFKFAAGVLSAESKKALNTTTGTVWLSDDTLIKQLNSREGQEFEVGEYANIPDVILQPEKIIKDETGYQLYKNINGKKMIVVLKILHLEKEIFVQSARKASDRQWLKVFKD